MPAISPFLFSRFEKGAIKMAEAGWLSKWAFQDDSLAADTTGRSAMADGYVQNDKIEAATITASRLTAGIFSTGVYGVGVYGTARYG